MSFFFPQCCFEYHSCLTALKKYVWVKIVEGDRDIWVRILRTFRNDLAQLSARFRSEVSYAAVSHCGENFEKF